MILKCIRTSEVRLTPIDIENDLSGQSGSAAGPFEQPLENWLTSRSSCMSTILAVHLLTYPF